MLDEQMHAGRLLLGVVHGQQHAHVADHGDDEGDAQDHDLDLGHVLVARERVGSVRVDGGAVRRGSHRRVSGEAGSQQGLVASAQERRVGWIAHGGTAPPCALCKTVCQRALWSVYGATCCSHGDEGAERGAVWLLAAAVAF